MNRKEFIKTCGFTCLGLMGIRLTQACKPSKQVQSSLNNNQLQINKKEFELLKGNKLNYRKSVVTKPENSDYPIVIYRFSETDYRAFLLRCTHQNNELNLNGDIMTCSAHGSEFTNRGEVLQGPAEQPLLAFKVTKDETNIYIHLS